MNSTLCLQCKAEPSICQPWFDMTGVQGRLCSGPIMLPFTLIDRTKVTYSGFLLFGLNICCGLDFKTVEVGHKTLPIIAWSRT